MQKFPNYSYKPTCGVLKLLGKYEINEESDSRQIALNFGDNKDEEFNKGTAIFSEFLVNKYTRYGFSEDDILEFLFICCYPELFPELTS